MTKTPSSRRFQLNFLLAHNTLMQRAIDDGLEAEEAFERARNTLRWLYQYIVWNDFLARVTTPHIHQNVLVKETSDAGTVRWKSNLEHIYSWKNQPYMPIEFSVAAYRFGHSMVRNSYQTNDPHRHFGVFAPIFDHSTNDPTVDDLSGFRPLTANNYVQWDWFLDMSSSSGPFPQRARKIDTKLSNALTVLREEKEAGSRMNILAFRNLVRSATFDLPAGSDVARQLGLNPIEIDPDHDILWYYILKEAEAQQQGEKLGEVGSTIVCATFAGLLLGDPFSYFSMNPNWTPDEDPLLKDRNDNRDDANWTLASIIRLSGQPVCAQGCDGAFPT